MPVNARLEYERYFEYTRLSVPESWIRDYGSDPADLHYFHAMNHYHRVGLWDSPFTPRSAQQQFELDVAMWYGSLTQGSDGEKAFLKRIFTVLYHGGLLYKGPNGWETWAASDIPIAAALSHGGRVLIQLPRAGGDAAGEFFNWLNGQDHIITANARLAATHGIQYLSYAAMQPLAAGRRHRVNEVKKGENHYGVNISLGGTGNHNPLSGNLIVSNGEHGHLYVFYLAPTEHNYGGLLVGCEGSAPIDAWDNRDSLFHRPGTHGRAGTAVMIGYGAQAWLKDKVLSDPTMFTPDQTGGFHKFGDRQRYSATGNAKWEELEVGPRQVYNGMIVDLVETGWEFLQQVGNFDPVDLGASGPAPRQIVRPPVPKIMTRTCLTKVNLERMKVVADQREKDLGMIQKGKTPVVKDYNAPKTSNPLGKNMAPKPMEQIQAPLNEIAHSMTPDGKRPMEYGGWLAFSNVALMSRGTRIQQVDDAVKQCLTVTGLSVSEYQLREQAQDPPRSADPDFTDRVDSLVTLHRVIFGYLQSTEDKSSRRMPAVRALRLLVMAEMKLLDDARLAIG